MPTKKIFLEEHNLARFLHTILVENGSQGENDYHNENCYHYQTILIENDYHLQVENGSQLENDSQVKLAWELHILGDTSFN